MKVRIRATDNFANQGSNTASPAFTVDTKGPIISLVTASQGSGTSTVNIIYTVSDDAPTNLTVFLDISGDLGFTWTVATSTLTGAIGAGQTAGVGKTITWNAGTDFANQYNANMKVRIRATDSFNNQGTNTASSVFTVDTKAPVVSNISASQNIGNGVVISYTLADDTSAGNTVLFGISSDNGATWTVATSTVSGNIGANQQAGNRTFTWDAGIDFPNQTSATMRARVRAIDVYGNSGVFAQSAAFSLDSAPPTITNILALQTAGTEQVNISYDIQEFSTTSTVALDISSDGGITWTVATSTLAGSIGANITSGINKIITWNAGTDDTNEESSFMRVRLRAIDVFNNISAYAVSSNFTLDTKAPANLSNFIKFSSTQTSATFHWTSAVDVHFSKYEIWYGHSATDVQNRTSTAALWNSTQDPLLTQALTTATVLTGINVQADFFVKIFAFDSYGHITSLPEINIFTIAPPPTPPAQIAPPAAVILPPPAPFGIPPRRPLLSTISSPINETRLVISGLADPRTRIDIYDAGTFVAQLSARTDSEGRFSQIIVFPEGPHILTARARDDANINSGFSDAMTFLVDITAPDAPHIISPAASQTFSEPEPVLFGVSESFVNIEVRIDAENILQTTADASGNWILVLPSSVALSIGGHSIVATAIDQAGNRSSQSGITVQVVPSPSVAIPSPGAPIAPSVPIAPISLISLPFLESGISPLMAVPPTPPTPVVIKEITEAIELPGLLPPRIENTRTVAQEGNVFAFSGTALPNQEVVVYVHSQAVLYQTRADTQGTWTVKHEQDRVELTPGDHAIFAIALNRGLKIKSRPSSVGIFSVEKNVWVMIFQYLNLQTTIITIGVLVMTVLALYGIRKKEMKKI
jgi:hypothetical protein